MGSPTQVLKLSLDVDDKPGRAAVDRFNKALSDVGKTGQRAGMEASGGLKQVDLSLAGWAKGYAAATGAVYGLKKAFDFLYGSATYAAKTEMFGVALAAVGKNAGYTNSELQKYTEGLIKIGTTDHVARQSLARMSAAGIDLGKSFKIAQQAQDLSRIAGISGSEALEQFIHGVVTLQPEVLRTIGITVNFEQEYSKFARTTGRVVSSLTAQEKIQIGLSAAMREAEKFTGTYNDTLGTTAGKMATMPRLWEKFQQALGKRLEPALHAEIEYLEQVLKKSTATVETLEFRGYRDMLTGPASRKAGRLIETDEEAAQILIDKKPDWQILAESEQNVRDHRQVLRADKRAAKILRNELLTSDSAAAAEMRKLTGWREARDERRTQAQTKYQQKIDEAVKQSQSLVEHAQIAELTGLERIRAERDAVLKQYRLTHKELNELRDAYASPQGVLDETIASNDLALKKLEGQYGGVIGNINRAFAIEAAGERKKMGEKATEASRDLFRDYREGLKQMQADRNKADLQRLEVEDQRWQYRLKTTEDLYAYEEDALRRSMDFELASLEAVSRKDVAGKLALEQSKLEIEKRYAQEGLKLALRTAEQKALIEAASDPGLTAQVQEALAQQRKQITETSLAEIRAMEARSARTQQQIQIDAWERTWDRAKRGAEAVFDSLTTRSRSFGEYFKGLWLQIFREIFTNQMARLFIGFMGGSNGGYGGAQPQGAMARGGFGGLGGLLGMGGMGGFGGFSGMPGGTGGFSGPVGGAGGGMGGMAGGLGWSGMLANYKGLLGKLGGMPTTVFDEMGQATTYGKGVYGAKGGGLLLGGGVLAAMGLKRGGWSGLGMTTAGGALMGAKFGPIGAAIGGAVGFGAGLIRMFFKGATEKAKEKIKTLYGLDVKDKSFLQQIVDMAKQTYAGNLDMAIRSTQIRDLLELYAMSTGQSFGLSGSVARPFVATQSGGGSIWQQVQYDSGRAYTQQSSLATMGGGGATVQVIIGDQSAAQAWQGEVVQATIVNNARTVQEATATASRGNHMRRSNWAQGAAPTQLLA